MDLGIRGKKALVCAASKGLGKAIALALAGEGVELLLVARSKESLAEVGQEAEKHGCKVHLAACDLSDPVQRKRLIEEAHAELKSVDILVHNTGGPKPTAAENTSIEEWHLGYEQLFPAIAELNLAFVPGMKERRWGRIIAVTSLSVLEPIANLAVSNAMRSAVTAMLKTLSDEIAAYDITVNCVAPGVIHTDRTESLMISRMERSGQSRDQYMRDFQKSVPAGRLGSPSEFGAVVAFLCSQQASYITGSTIAVDGGKRRSTY